MKADRNKTIDMTVEEGKEYPDRCLRISEKKALEEVLDKNFYGKKFKKISDEMYEEYTVCK